MIKISRISFLLAVCLVSFSTAFADSETAGEWSAPVDGVRGRLVVDEGTSPGGGLHVVNAYLELQNVSDVSSPLEIYYQDASLRGQLLDKSGVNFAGGGFPASIMTPLPYRLVLPYDGTLRFRVSVTGYFLPKKDCGTLLALNNDAWLMKSGEEYFLQAAFTAVRSGEAGHREWAGILQLPKVKIPLSATPS